MTRYLTRDTAAIAAGALGPLALAAILLPWRGSWPNTNVALLLVVAVVAVACLGNRLIQDADHDRKGVLDSAGYTRLAAAYGASAGQAARAFARLDLDRNGVLDAAELTAAITQFFTSPDPDAPGNLTFGRL